MTDLSFLKELKQIPDPLAGTGAPVAKPGGEPPRPPRLEPGSPRRLQTQRRRMAALAVSMAWLVVHLSIYGIREDFAQLPASYVVAQVLLPMLFGAGSLLVAVAPGKLGLGIGVGVIATLALLGPASFWLLAALVRVPHFHFAASNRFWVGSLVCLDITLAWAAAPLLLAALSLRRAFVSAAVWRSALVGAALGLFSGAAINLHCPNADPAHVLMGHGVPVAMAALLGAFVVVRWARA